MNTFSLFLINPSHILPKTIEATHLSTTKALFKSRCLANLGHSKTGAL